ncbi:hypothetical protein FB566_3867 [Stackebrandtia endophytica]|uniref:Uncharacterized protein n=1 Tax=Stackebrandtia endophytica TaxID=1496996 RepID=A0A543B0D2_9ACTN|nr:hypothetical protein [Stackebrandtia endophytica]TQL78284.1 hypothetical protein FB566_3867 [Stackebrandtia endophytica]
MRITYYSRDGFTATHIYGTPTELLTLAELLMRADGSLPLSDDRDGLLDGEVPFTSVSASVDGSEIQRTEREVGGSITFLGTTDAQRSLAKGIQAHVRGEVTRIECMEIEWFEGCDMDRESLPMYIIREGEPAGRQVGLYLHSTDYDRVHEFVRENLNAGLYLENLREHEVQPVSVPDPATYRHVICPKEYVDGLSVGAAGTPDAPIDIVTAPAIEWMSSPLRDGTLHMGRFFYATSHWDRETEAVRHKPQDFLTKADSLLRWVDRHMPWYDDAVRPGRLGWEAKRLIDRGELDISWLMP